MPRERDLPAYTATYARRPTRQPPRSAPPSSRRGAPPGRHRRDDERDFEREYERDQEPPKRLKKSRADNFTSKGKPRRSWPQRLILGGGISLVVVALLGLGGVAYVMKSIGDIERYDDLGVDAVAAGEPSNYLVVGSDSRAETGDEFGDVGGQRSDTIMVLRLDPETKAASVLSIPRDLLVTIAGSGETARINSAYSISRQALIDTLRANFGIEINHYIEVDFGGFQELVDAVGGVPLYLDRAIKDDHSGLFQSNLGCVTLNGEQALAFARSRHLQVMTPDGWSNEDPYADLGRIQRQQVFIRRAVVTALGTVKSNPLKVREFLDIATDNVGIDAETDPLGLVDEFKDFDVNNLKTYSIPVLDSGDGATVVTDRDAADPILNVFRGLEPGEVSPYRIEIVVLNGTGTEGQAGDAAAAFEGVGFKIAEPSDIEPHERTTIYHLPGEDNFALQVARYVTGGADIKVREDLGLTSGQVAVATGTDFTTVHMQPTPLDQMPEREGAPAQTTTPAAASGSGGGDDGGGDSASGGGDGGAPATTSTTQPPSTESQSEYTIGDPPPGIRCG
jgi:LCP family protein required for cell wall assembly